MPVRKRLQNYLEPPPAECPAIAEESQAVQLPIAAQPATSFRPVQASVGAEVPRHDLSEFEAGLFSNHSVIDDPHPKELESMEREAARQMNTKLSMTDTKKN